MTLGRVALGLCVIAFGVILAVALVDQRRYENREARAKRSAIAVCLGPCTPGRKIIGYRCRRPGCELPATIHRAGEHRRNRYAAGMLAILVLLAAVGITKGIAAAVRRRRRPPLPPPARAGQ